MVEPESGSQRQTVRLRIMEARVFDRIVKELAGSDAPRAALHRLAEEWPEYVCVRHREYRARPGLV